MFVSYICIEKCDADAANTKNQIREYEELMQHLSTSPLSMQKWRSKVKDT